MTRPLAAVLAVWCLWFAALHGAWALGWRWGVPPEMPPIHTRPVFLAYDVIAGVAMVALGGIGALLAARPDRARSGLPRLVLWVAAITCGLRFAIGAVGDAMTLAASQVLPTVTWLADVWFGITTALAIALLRTSRRRTPTS